MQALLLIFALLSFSAQAIDLEAHLTPEAKVQRRFEEMQQRLRLLESRVQQLELKASSSEMDEKLKKHAQWRAANPAAAREEDARGKRIAECHRTVKVGDADGYLACFRKESVPSHSSSSPR
jgi:hypothetical protein